MRPTCLTVNLDAIKANYRQAQSLAGGPLLCVVKANAYGHGLVPVSRALAAAGGAWLGVATVGEGATLRAVGIELPILLMGGFLGEQEAADVVKHRLTPALFTDALIAPLSQAAQAADTVLPVHVKIDSGMGRIGFPLNTAATTIRNIMTTPGLRVEGVFSHFAEADLADSPAADRQLAAVRQLYAELKSDDIPIWHMANSAALMRRMGVDLGEVAHLSRPGIMLYGERPAAGFCTELELATVATWTAFLIQVKNVPSGTPISYGGTFVTRRPSRIATVPVGYADGYRRALSNNASVLIRGCRAPVVGRVCMDMFMVDVTDLPDDVETGERVVLLGRDGNENITADELGAASDTISYDILCGISERVPRRYVGDGSV